MTARTSAQIAIEIAEVQSERLSTFRNLSTYQRDEILSQGKIVDLVTDYERARAREATAEPATWRDDPSRCQVCAGVRMCGHRVCDCRAGRLRPEDPLCGHWRCVLAREGAK